MANTNLSKAKSAKNDEFYTQYADIQKEVNAYLDYNPDTFRGKTVLLPCDDPEWSKFTRRNGDITCGGLGQTALPSPFNFSASICQGKCPSAHCPHCISSLRNASRAS